MIQWKKYQENQPPSHKLCLVTNGSYVLIADHASRYQKGYKWANYDGILSDVTHYAEIELPQAIDPTAQAQADKGG